MSRTLSIEKLNELSNSNDKNKSIVGFKTNCSNQYPFILLRWRFNHSNKHNPNNCTACAKTHLTNLSRLKVVVGGNGARIVVTVHPL